MFEGHCCARKKLLRLLRIMRLLSILLLAGALQVSASVKAQKKVSLHYSSISVIDALSEVRKQSQFELFYNLQSIDQNRILTIDIEDADLLDALKQILGEGFKYRILDKMVVISRIDKKKTDKKEDEKTIKGKVVDEKGKPIPGCTVFVVGTTKGVSTDMEGNFILKVAGLKDLVLEISCIGMKSKKVKVVDNKFLKVVLEEDTQKLEEVVVTGIFERKAESFTGSTVTMKREDLQRVGNTNLFQSLKSLDPSLMIFDNMEFGSDPNKNPKMTLRGASSINTSVEDLDIKGTYANDPNAPLFILDGFEASVQKIMDLDMDRVASLTILKDASAKAIYGSRAANGVIVIETIRSKEGEVRITFTENLNIEAPDLDSYNLTSSAQKLELEKDFGLYDADSYTDEVALLRKYNQKHKAVVAGVDTDWLSKPLRNAIGHKHSIIAELGSNDLKMIASFSYNNIQGVMKGSSRETYDGSINVSYRHKNFNFRNILSVVSNVAKDSPYGRFSEYALINPYYSPYDENGLLVKNAALSLDGLGVEEFVPNPLYNASLNTKIEQRYLDVTNNLYVEWNMLTGMKATLRFGITEKRNNADEFYPSNHLKFNNYGSDDFFRRGSYQVNNGHLKKLSGDLNVRYSKQLGEKHYIFTNFGVNVSEETYEEVVHKAEGFPNDRMTDIIFARQYLKDSKPKGKESTIRDLGLLGVFNYTYDNKYLVDFSLRGSASSQFGSDNRWGKFWSVGVGWNMHKESFINEDIFDRIKWRASVGYTGSQSQKAYAAMGTYNYFLDRTYTGYLGGYLKGMRNQELQWQKKMDYNVGLDLNIKRRVSITLDVYKAVTENTLIDLTLPPSVGFANMRENVGSVINTGFDLRTSFIVLQNTQERSFLNISTSISSNKNELDKLSEAMHAYNENQLSTSGSGRTSLPGQMYYDGVSMDAIWGVRSLGIDPRNGREIYLKKDGTPTYEYDASDQVVLGDRMPDFQGTSGVNFEYRGFGGNLTFRYQYGAQLYNTTLINKVENANLNNNVDIRLYDGVWRPGDEGKIKPYKTLGKVWISEKGEWEQLKTQPTSRFVQDRNELTLSNLSFYYDFYRCSFIKKWGMERLKLSFYMNNVFTLSSIDIERGTSYPFASTYNFSLSVTL